MSHIAEDLVELGIEDEKKGAEVGKWRSGAGGVVCQDRGRRVAWFMRKWHIRQAEASAKLELARAAAAEAAAVAAKTGAKAAAEAKER